MLLTAYPALGRRQQRQGKKKRKAQDDESLVLSIAFVVVSPYVFIWRRAPVALADKS